MKCSSDLRFEDFEDFEARSVESEQMVFEVFEVFVGSKKAVDSKQTVDFEGLEGFEA